MLDTLILLGSGIDRSMFACRNIYNKNGFTIAYN